MEIKKMTDPMAQILGGSTVPEPIRKATETKKAKWVDLEELYALLSEGLANFGQDVLKIERSIQSAGIRITDPKINAMRKTITEDIERFTNEALVIRQEHIHRTGYVNGGEDLRVYLMIYDKYRASLSFFQGVMQQHAIALTEISIFINELVAKKES